MTNSGTINAEFTSYWDDGEHVCTSKCKVNLHTNEVTHIEPIDNISNALNHLDRETVTIFGKEYPVYFEEELADLEPEQVIERHFWYGN